MYSTSGDLHLELILDGHQQVHHVQRIGAQVVGQVGLRGDGILFHVELSAQDRLDLFQYHIPFLLKIF